MDSQRTQYKVGVFTSNWANTDHLLIKEDGKRLFGTIGARMHSILSKILYNVTYVEVTEIGIDLGNGSFTGAIGRIQNQALDLFCKPEPFDMHPPDVRITNPVSSQDVRVVYRPLIRQKNVELLEGFIHFPVSFARLFLLAIVTCVALVVLHNQIRRDLRRLHQTSTNVLWLFGSLCLVNPPSLRHLSSSLFLHWIMFIACFRLISFVYSGAVSTRLVLLDTHDLMHSLDQIVNSGRRPCWMKEEKYLNDFSQRPKQSQYRQLWDNQAKNRCWLEKSANLWSITDNLSKICGIAYSWYIRIGCFFLCAELNVPFFWIVEKSLFQYPEGFYMSRELHIRQGHRFDMFKYRISGAEAALYDQLKQSFELSFRSNVRRQCVYSDARSLMQDYIPEVSNIKLIHVLISLKMLGCAQAIILIVFIFNHAISKHGSI